MFVKHVVDIQALFLQKEWEKFVILNLIYEYGAYSEKHVESRTGVRICRPIFVGVMDRERI